MAINTLSSSVAQQVDALDKKTETLMGNMHEQVVKQDSHQRCITELENKLQLAMDYIDQNRHSQHNLRLLNVPESLEGNVGMIGFLVKLLHKEWKVKVKEEDFENAPRLGPLKENVRFPCTIIFKMHHLQKKILTLKAVREQEKSGEKISRHSYKRNRRCFGH